MESEPRQGSQESGADRRAAIAAAARSLIAERGFEGLRTRDIADRVGINIATLHYHVPSKEALICIVAQSMRDDFIAQNDSKPRDGPPLEQLRTELEDFRVMLREDPELLLVFAELMERARRDGNVAAAIRPMVSHWHAQLTDILGRGRDDGSFRSDLDPPAAAAMIIGALRGVRTPLDPGSDHFDRLAAELMRSVRSRPVPRGSRS